MRLRHLAQALIGIGILGFSDEGHALDSHVSPILERWVASAHSLGQRHIHHYRISPNAQGLSKSDGCKRFRRDRREQ